MTCRIEVYSEWSNEKLYKELVKHKKVRSFYKKNLKEYPKEKEFNNILNEINKRVRKHKKNNLRMKIVDDLINSNGDMAAIQKAVAHYYGTPLEHMIKKLPKHKVEFLKSQEAKHVAAYLVRNLLKSSYKKIAMGFNLLDHTSIIHCCKWVDKKIEADENFKKKIYELKKLMKGIKNDI